MPRRRVLYQCQTCGWIVGARDRRAHLADQHQTAAISAKEVNAGFTTFDPMDPSRADKWNYSDEEIGGVIPGLQEPGEEGSNESTESRPGRA